MSSLSDLAKTKASRVMGIDASTQSVAFTIFYNRKPVKWGKINLSGSNIYDRMLDARLKVAALNQEFQVDYIVVEAAIQVKSVDVAIKLAYVFGTIISELMSQGAKVVTVAPITWQSHIGNKLLTPDERAEIIKNNPGHKPSWYQNTGRKLRKQRTMDFFNKRYGMNITDNDVGDSCGLAFYGYQTLTKRT